MSLLKTEDEYDLIVSNPPFYSENYKQKMNNAIFAVPAFEDLIEAAFITF
jgi:tRNA1(Val) A37 N6-methylase TrmN6